jgi:hypothetical protein
MQQVKALGMIANRPVCSRWGKIAGWASYVLCDGCVEGMNNKYSYTIKPVKNL